MYPFLASSILAFFNRRQLCALSNVDRRLCNVVDIEFPLAPYLILEELVFGMHGNEWEIRASNCENAFRNVTPPTAKYLRFRYTSFLFDEKFKGEPMELVKSVSHVWNSQVLAIYFYNKETLEAAELARQLSTCRFLEVIGNNCLSVLTYLLEFAQCDELIFEDDSSTITALLLDKAISFLSKASQIHRFLTIRIVNNPNTNHCERFFDKIKQIFEQATTPLQFTLKVHHPRLDIFELPYPQDVVVHNAITTQDLRLEKQTNNWTNFTLSTENNSDNIG
ncbi:hypothetical protein DdX_03703 [Ditylenchus destructor]|uniref:Uncharacterized protein n=1 Tax=Ditylenchus destructor TaxID=166010 RepID=A0AAD4NFH3_9BILA|nr:hypothetical protein DdX_03703 [Ditylenchus destructor]